VVRAAPRAGPTSPGTRRRAPVDILTGVSDRIPVPAPDPQITCIDCGGRSFLLTAEREGGGWFDGDIVAYRCEDCLDRWDLVLESDDPDAGRDDLLDG
jgi:hypothetical protein